jgi:hypothetical protein
MSQSLYEWQEMIRSCRFFISGVNTVNIYLFFSFWLRMQRDNKLHWLQSLKKRYSIMHYACIHEVSKEANNVCTPNDISYKKYSLSPRHSGPIIYSRILHNQIFTNICKVKIYSIRKKSVFFKQLSPLDFLPAYTFKKTFRYSHPYPGCHLPAYYANKYTGLPCCCFVTACQHLSTHETMKETRRRKTVTSS